MSKIFAHRGFVRKEAKENSLESLNAAYREKFDGIEFDVWFVANELVVNHDKPSSIAGLPHFVDYLKFANNLEYWIDFKNLDKIPDDEVESALNLAKQAIALAKIDMKKIYFAPFVTNFPKALKIYQKIREIFGQDAQIMAVCEKITREKVANFCEKLRAHKIKFLSINYKNLDEKFMKNCDDITLFAWTINDLQDLKRVKKLGVVNFTSDKFRPADLQGFD